MLTVVTSSMGLWVILFFILLMFSKFSTLNMSVVIGKKKKTRYKGNTKEIGGLHDSANFYSQVLDLKFTWKF